MRRLTMAAGWIIGGIGVIHLAVFLAVLWGPASEIVQSGVVGSLTGQGGAMAYDRTLLWYGGILLGLALALVGAATQLLIHATGRPAPRGLGFGLAGVGAAGCVVDPASGAWLILAVGLLMALAQARRRRRPRGVTAHRTGAAHDPSPPRSEGRALASRAGLRGPRLQGGFRGHLGHSTAEGRRYRSGSLGEMNYSRTGALTLAAVMLFGLAACSAGSAPVDMPVYSTGQIYLYGELHGEEAILEKEYEIWQDNYQDGMRHLFIEVPYYTAEFLNIWMRSDNDDIMDAVLGNAAGTQSDVPAEVVFYRQIKESCPETVFHGTDIGHQFSTTGKQFLEYLEQQGLKDSEQYSLV